MPEPEGPLPGGVAATHGDLALVLHSHMPYVEGFGTYPFGEEWLFDAVIRSYLPLLEIADSVTMTVTPVLADQLEDEATARRLREFLLRHRISAAEADAQDADPECRPAAAAEAAQFRHSLDLLDSAGGDPLAAFQRAAAEGRVALAASSATHAVLPLLATRAGRRFQIETGLRSHRRRFGKPSGFWLPECAYRPGLEAELAEHGIEWFCVDQSRTPFPGEELAPVATTVGAADHGGRSGPVTPGPLAFVLDWSAIEWLWSWEGYPSHPDHAQFDGKSLRGSRIWRIGGGPYVPEAGRDAAKRQAEQFAQAIADRLRSFRQESGGERGLITYAFDTELLGHWWAEGTVWLNEALRLLPEKGVRLITLDQAAAEYGSQTGREARHQALLPSTWGEGKDLRTWDGQAVSDLTWAARRLELRLLRAIRGGLTGPRAERAARELLAVQSSDWAFIDGRRQAGDYAFERATDHSHAALEALDCTTAPDPRMRSLAPDMTLSPLLEP